MSKQDLINGAYKTAKPKKLSEVEAYKLRRLVRIAKKIFPVTWGKVDNFFVYKRKDCENDWSAFCTADRKNGRAVIGISDSALNDHETALSNLLHELAHVIEPKHTTTFLRILRWMIRKLEIETGVFISLGDEEVRYNLSDALAGCRLKVSGLERFDNCPRLVKIYR